MRFIGIGALLIGLLLPVEAIATMEPHVEDIRKIAITFDDAPKPDGVFFTGEERSKRLVKALEDAGVKEAMFFVRTKGLLEHGQEGATRVRRYTDAGHVLGNHSHSHTWLRKTEAEAYLKDIAEAKERLQSFDNVLPYFRYPFLDEGRKPEKRAAVRAGLNDLELKNGYVTVDNYDWYMDRLAQEAAMAGLVDMLALRQVYVELLVEAVEFYDAIAMEALGRSPKHVLLLHENDLAALFVDDLVSELKVRGWDIIPASAAYDDPIAGVEPETRFNGQGRVAAIAHTQGKTGRELVHYTEDEVFLREEFIRRGILGAPDP